MGEKGDLSEKMGFELQRESFCAILPQNENFHKGWSSEDYSVKRVIKLPLFQSPRVSQNKTTDQNSFHRFTLEKKEQKKTIPHTQNRSLPPLFSMYWGGLGTLFTHAVDTCMRTRVGELKIILTICFCYPIPNFWWFFLYLMETNAYFDVNLPSAKWLEVRTYCY